MEDGDDSSSDSSSSSDGVEEDGAVKVGAAEVDDNSRYSGLRYKKDNTNQRSVFLACRFLLGRLPDLMFLDNNSTEKFSVARSSHSFKTLIKEPRRQEPTLKQATPLALHLMYNRVVKQYGKMDAVLKMETGGLYEYKLIQLAEYAKDIYDLHNDFVAQKFRTTAERKLAKEREAEEQDVINAAAVQGSILILGERRALDNAEGNDVDEFSSTSTIAKSASIRARTTVTKPSTHPTRSTPITTSSVSQATLDAAARLSDMQNRLYTVFQSSNEKYDDMADKHRTLSEHVATLAKRPVIEDLQGTLDLFHNSMTKLKAMVRTLGHKVIELRTEVREMKRKFGNVEIDITDVQKDIYRLKKKK
ncbi:hypothetical protein BGZ47_011810 [Haplosporangium gracile]|nr:hypothetical protein BGZ47_011810 [Haplosporangium gracile]